MSRGSRSAALLAATLGLAVFAVAGCGDDDDDETGAADEASTELAVTLDPDGDGRQPTEDAALNCPEDGSGDPPAACATVAGLSAEDADPVPPDTPCTKIFGGPEVVTIAGTLAGEPVDAELTRADGCEIERFARFEPLLGALFPDYRAGAELKG